ncbi:MAG: triose-phosphate isomerase [Gemmatimonadales bacterium]|nr:triose-phosphate isomerase [Gemmatimonadales bacterium]
MRRPIVAANWKMHLGRVDQALALVRRIRLPLGRVEGVDVVLCPPFTVLASLAEVIGSKGVALGAQNMHWDDHGAQTGEISPSMLVGLCRYVIIGHSERRASGGSAESDGAVNRKVISALTHGLTPIICVGEDAARNEAGETDVFVGGQVRAALDGLSADDVGRVVLAYEPIWAIGTGRSATPAAANRTIALAVRGTIALGFGEAVAGAVRVQYGGSVNAQNIAGFMAMPEIDGALVGGASLQPEFVDLVTRAVAAR